VTYFDRLLVLPLKTGHFRSKDRLELSEGRHSWCKKSRTGL